MKTNEMIAGLRKLSGQGSEYRRTVCRQAAEKLEELTVGADAHIGPPSSAPVGADAHIGPNQRWIPVTERLPEGMKDVLVIRAHGDPDIEFLFHDGTWVGDTEGKQDVTHWMPLPEPPKGVRL